MSYWRTFYHLIWATRQRKPLITPTIEQRLYPYLVHKAAQMEVGVLAIGGWTDHIHMVVSIPPKLAIAGLVKALKGASSHDLNHQSSTLDIRTPHFAWQQGYGALTIGERHCPIAIDYVRRQKEHHAQQTTIPRLHASDDEEHGVPLPASPDHPIVPTLHESSQIYRIDIDPFEDDSPF